MKKKYMLYAVSEMFFNYLGCSSWTPSLMMIMILLLILISVMVLPPFDSKPSIKYFLNLFIIKKALHNKFYFNFFYDLDVECAGAHKIRLHLYNHLLPSLG